MSGLRIAMALATCTVALSAASAAADDIWTPAPALNGAFSVDTPCTVAEVVKFRAVPEPLVPGVTFVPDSRIACRHGTTMLVAGVIAVPGYPPTALAIFDAFAAQAKADKTAEGVQSTSTINGRRAWLNREEKEGVLAQTGFIEIDRSRIVLLVGGVNAGSGLPIEAQRAIVDRFYGSVKVTAR